MTAKGANVFRVAKPLSTRDPNIDPALYEEEERQQNAQLPEGQPMPSDEREESPIAWSPTPSPTPSVSINHSISALKRTCSATVPFDAAPGPSKRIRNNSASAALQGLTSELQNFGATFLDGITATATPLPAIPPSPVRKTKAIQQAQDLEQDLDDESLAKLICIFQADVNAADAYVVIKREGLCKAWISSTLGQ
jgi:hypothetical protein